MRTEFRKVRTADEIGSLMAFDRKVFSGADCFPRDHWLGVLSYWMLIDGIKAGCCAFENNVDFQQDQRRDGANRRLPVHSTSRAPPFSLVSKGTDSDEC